MKISKPRDHRARPSRQSGLSLVELMVGLTVGLVISLGLFMLVTNTSRSFKVQDDFARLMENGNSALKYLVDDLRMAGFFGYASKIDYPTDATFRTNAGIEAITGDCGAADGDGTPWAFQMHFPVRVYSDDGAGGPLTPANVNSRLPCIQSNDFAVANRSVLVMRGALGFQLQDTNGDNSVANEIAAQPNYTTTYYVQSTPNQSPSTIFFRGDKYASLRGAGSARTVVSAGVAQDAPVFEFQAHVYYIRPCSRPTPPATTCSAAGTDDGGISIPTLVRHELVGSTMQLVPLVEGIERVVLLYGLDSNQDGVADRYSATVLDTEWDQVVSARVSVLARTPTTTPGYSDANKSYDLGGGVVFTCTPGTNCNFKRHVFSQTTSIRNCSMRRAAGQLC